MEPDPPIPAATLIVMRPAAAPAAAAPAPAALACAAAPAAANAARAPRPEILVVERAAAMAFAGGAMVFPGGRIDAADVALASALGRPHDAARITAIRETIEESAVVVGVSGLLAPGLGLTLQDALIAGEDFAALLAHHDLALDLDALTAFARWMPAFKQARRFDTMFFVAAALPGKWPPHPQPGECAAAAWTTAQAQLDRIAAGTDHAIFPTKRTLERLARFATFDDVRADAARHSLDTIVPWVEQRDGAAHVCIPADRGYPITSEPLATAFRA